MRVHVAVFSFFLLFFLLERGEKNWKRDWNTPKGNGRGIMGEEGREIEVDIVEASVTRS